MAAKKYKRIARGSNSLERCYLYATEDHLLQVTGSYTEEYRRFYYKDIKGALIQEHTVKNRVCAGVLIALIALCVLLFASGSEIALGFGAFFSVVTFVLLLLLLPTLVTGGFATLYLVTSVQQEKVSAVSGRRKARKVVHKIEDRLVELGLASPIDEVSNPAPNTAEAIS